MLVEAGAEKDQPAMEGVTPLFAAAFSGRFEVARFLVQAMQHRHGKLWQWNGLVLCWTVCKHVLTLCHRPALIGTADQTPISASKICGPLRADLVIGFHQLELVVAALILHFWLSSRKCCISNSLRPPSHEKKKSQYVAANTLFSCLAGDWTIGIPPKQQLSESCMVIVGILLHLFHPSWVFLKLQDGALKKARLQCCNVSMCTRATTHGAVAPTPAGCLGWGDCISFTSASQPAETFRLCRHRLRPDVGALLGGTKREANRGFEISEDWDC